METKRELIEKNGFDFEGFELENEHSAKNLLLAMDEYAGQRLQQFIQWHNGKFTGQYIPNSRIGMFNQYIKQSKE